MSLMCRRLGCRVDRRITSIRRRTARRKMDSVRHRYTLAVEGRSIFNQFLSISDRGVRAVAPVRGTTPGLLQGRQLRHLGIRKRGPRWLPEEVQVLAKVGS